MMMCVDQTTLQSCGCLHNSRYAWIHVLYKKKQRYTTNSKKEKLKRMQANSTPTRHEASLLDYLDGIYG